MTAGLAGPVGIELTPEHPIDRIASLAGRAEDVGFEDCYVASHYFNRDPLAAATRIAAETATIRVGTAGANPYETHPVALASRIATLQEASDGRAVFGLGPGDASALGSLGIDRERPLRRVLETMEVSRDLWDGHRVTHDGTFRADDAGIEYDVDRPPVYVAAQGPHMLRMAGKYADGVLVNAAHPLDLEWSVERIVEGVNDRDPERGVVGPTGGAVQGDGEVHGDADHHGDGDVLTLAYASVSIDDDREAARDLARRPVAFIAAGASPAVLDRHELDHERAEQIGAALERGAFREAFDAVSPAMLEALSVAGTPEDVEERLGEIATYVDGIVVGSPLGPDLEGAIDLAAQSIDRLRD